MNSLALATRRTKLVFRLSVMEACCRIVLVLAGLYFFRSLMGVIIARVVMSVVMFIMSMLAARSMIGARLSSQVINLWKVVAASAAMTVLVLMMRHGLQGATINVAVQLALTAVFGAAIYVAALAVLGVRPQHYLSGLGAPG
jgi:hypothetical protein